jgi:hypothetical protein
MIMPKNILILIIVTMHTIKSGNFGVSTLFMDFFPSYKVKEGLTLVGGILQGTTLTC